MVGRNARRAGILALTLLGIGTSAAPAATTVGSSLRTRANLYVRCPTACTDLQTARPGGTSLAVPADGVLTVWRLRAASLGTVRLRVLRPQPDGTLLVVGSSDPATLDRQHAPGKDVLYTFVTRVAVRTGDRFALDRDRRAGAVFHSYGGDVSWATATLAPPPADGSAFPPPATTDPGRELLLNADVEADADGDGYGDDTQDACPKDPANHDKSACPASASPAGQTPGTTPGAVDVGGEPSGQRQTGPPRTGEPAADKSQRGHGGRPAPRAEPHPVPEGDGRHGTRVSSRPTPHRAGANDRRHGRRPAARPTPHERRTGARRRHTGSRPSRPAPHRRRTPSATHPRRPHRGAPPRPHGTPTEAHDPREQRPAPRNAERPGLQSHAPRPQRADPGS